MLSNLEYLNWPIRAVLVVILLIVISQIIGAIMDIKDDVAPGILHITKAIRQSREHHKIIKKLPEQLNSVVDSMNTLAETVKEIKKATDKNREEILRLKLDSQRTTCLDFTSCVISGKRRYTKEMWKKVDKIFKEYEKTIEEEGIENGEMCISHKLFLQKYEEAIRDNDFLQ